MSVMSESVIDSLPSELLCYILSKLDGCSLTRAGQVCQRWRVIVTALGRGFNIWYRHCLKEYGLEAVVALTGLTILLTRPGRMLAESRKELWTFWKEVYAVKQRSDCVCAGLWAVKMEKAEMWEGVVTAMTLTHPAGMCKVSLLCLCCQFVCLFVDCLSLGNMQSLTKGQMCGDNNYYMPPH